MPRNQPVDDDDDDDNLEGDDAIRNQRRRIKELEKENKTLADERADLLATKRELAMTKAGVDMDSKLGQMFAKQFEGDLADIAAIKAEATELGLIKTETPAADAPAADDPNKEPVIPAEDAASAAERRNLASGALPDDGKGVDVRANAMKLAEDSIASGSSFEAAAGGFINKLAAAAVAGDQSVLVR